MSLERNCATRVLIMCAGDESRWNNHLGIRKQLAPIDGVPLLLHTIRSLKRQGISDIHIVTHCADLAIEGSLHFDPPRRRWLIETIETTIPLWTARTVILLGDVFYTDSAMEKILHSSAPFEFFGRMKGSTITGCSHEECFGMSFESRASTMMRNALEKSRWLALWCSLQNAPRGLKLILNLFRAAWILTSGREGNRSRGFEMLKTASGLFERKPPRKIRALARPSMFWQTARLLIGRTPKYSIPVGRLWSLYCFVENLDLKDHLTRRNSFTEINDFTEDFDVAEDYDNWIERYRRARKNAS